MGDSKETGKWNDEGTGTKAVTLQMPKEMRPEKKTGFSGEESNDGLLRTELGP